jgi:hypothetical protein
MLTRVPVPSDATWTAPEMADPTLWSDRLSEDQCEEIVRAAKAAEDLGRTPATLRAEDFDLPSLRDLIAGWSKALADGPGFVLVRAFPLDQLNSAQVELAYVGLGLQLGTPVSQDAKGNLLGHVRDEGVERHDPSVRLYQTNKRQDFHSDGADIVGLLCLRPARVGGESRIASTGAIYNRILEERPDLIDVLHEPMYWDRNDEQSEGEDPYFTLPVLNDVGGSPRMFFIGWYIRDAQRHPQVPRLSDAQLEAIEAIEAAANDPAVHLEMAFEPGDIQLLANARILHCREAFEDDDDPANRRHLLRLWLAARSFTGVEDLLRGGIPARKGA